MEYCQFCIFHVYTYYFWRYICIYLYTTICLHVNAYTSVRPLFTLSFRFTTTYVLVFRFVFFHSVNELRKEKEEH